MIYKIARDPDGRPVCVLRAKDPGVAHGLATLLARMGDTPDGASLVASLPSQMGFDKFDVPGFLGTDVPDRAAVVDESGRFVGGLQEGDCFVAFDLTIARAKGLTNLARLRVPR